MRAFMAMMLAAFFGAGAMTLTGCEDEGPIEETIEEIDEGLEDAGDEIEDAFD